MIVGVSTGIPWETIRPWAASARRVSEGRLVLLTDEPQRYATLEDQYGVELVPASLRRESAGVCDITRTRWECLAELLTGEVGKVCFVDTRDAVFQADPFSRIGDKLLISSEGKPHRVNGWALGWVNALAPDWTERMKGLPILCAGAIGGPAPLLKEFATVMYHRFPKIACQCTDGQAHMGDQALVNVLWRDGFADRAEVSDDWAFHCLSFFDGGPWVIADLIAGAVCAADGKQFPIVHQVDRVPALAHFQEIR